MTDSEAVFFYFCRQLKGENNLIWDAIFKDFITKIFQKSR
jgi:hypothetical protein